MAACGMDNGRWGNHREDQPQAEKNRYTYGRVTIRHFPTDETTEERKARYALATGTSKGLWK